MSHMARMQTHEDPVWLSPGQLSRKTMEGVLKFQTETWALHLMIKRGSAVQQRSEGEQWAGKGEWTKVEGDSRKRWRHTKGPMGAVMGVKAGERHDCMK